mgnify:CR=1 FL=1
MQAEDSRRKLNCKANLWRCLEFQLAAVKLRDWVAKDTWLFIDNET